MSFTGHEDYDTMKPYIAVTQKRDFMIWRIVSRWETANEKMHQKSTNQYERETTWSPFFIFLG